MTCTVPDKYPNESILNLNEIEIGIELQASESKQNRIVKFVSILSPSRRKAITAQTTFLHQLVILSTSQSLICKLTRGIVLAPCRGSKVSMKSRLGCSGMRPGWIISALPAWAKKTGGFGVSSSYLKIKYINKEDLTVISHQSPSDWAMLQVDERPVWKRACLRIQT